MIFKFPLVGRIRSGPGVSPSVPLPSLNGKRSPARVPGRRASTRSGRRSAWERRASSTNSVWLGAPRRAAAKRCSTDDGMLSTVGCTIIAVGSLKSTSSLGRGLPRCSCAPDEEGSCAISRDTSRAISRGGVGATTWGAGGAGAGETAGGVRTGDAGAAGAGDAAAAGGSGRGCRGGGGSRRTRSRRARRSDRPDCSGRSGADMLHHCRGHRFQLVDELTCPARHRVRRRHSHAPLPRGQPVVLADGRPDRHQR